MDEDFTYGLTSFLFFIFQWHASKPDKMGYAPECAVFALFWFCLVHVHPNGTLVANICILFCQSEGTSAGRFPSDGLLTSDWQAININSAFRNSLNSLQFCFSPARGWDCGSCRK